jgi:hypothetical protein
MKYRHLTSFYGSVERVLALLPDGSARYYRDVDHAVQEAVKIGESGPFTLVTRVELIPDEPVKKQPDLVDTTKIEARRALQQELYDALVNLMSKGQALAVSRALPEDIDGFDEAFKWATRTGK